MPPKRSSNYKKTLTSLQAKATGTTPNSGNSKSSSRTAVAQKTSVPVSGSGSANNVTPTNVGSLVTTTAPSASALPTQVTTDNYAASVAPVSITVPSVTTALSSAAPASISASTATTALSRAGRAKAYFQQAARTQALENTSSGVPSGPQLVPLPPSPPGPKIPVTDETAVIPPVGHASKTTDIQMGPPASAPQGIGLVRVYEEHLHNKNNPPKSRKRQRGDGHDDQDDIDVAPPSKAANVASGPAPKGPLEYRPEDAPTLAALHGDAPEDLIFGRLLRAMDALHVSQTAMVQKMDEMTQQISRVVQLNPPPGCVDDVPPSRPGRRSGKAVPPPTDWNQKAPCEESKEVEHTEPARLAMMGYCRQVINELLGRPSRRHPLPDGPPPGITMPTADAFWINWDEPYHSPFNTAACDIATDQIISEFPTLFTEDNRDDIASQVSAHISYLITQVWPEQGLPAEDTSRTERLRGCSAKTRMRTTLSHRLKLIDAIPALQIHKRLIVDLSLDGTSSDEEASGAPRRYLIHRRKELSPQVQELKRKLDLAYELLYKGPGSKGSQVRKRIPSQIISTRKFRIKNLPLNCANPSWLSGLTDAQRAWYKFNDHEYDFSFPEELLKPL